MMEMSISSTTIVMILLASMAQSISGRLIPAKVQVLTQDFDEIKRTSSLNSVKISSGERRVRYGGTLSFVKVSSAFLMENRTIGCVKRRMRKFIGNKQRNCTSLKPLKFVLCVGRCIPKARLNQYFVSFQRLKHKTKYQYRCSPHRFKYKKLRVYCGDDGTVTRYRIKVVDSCKCKEYKEQQNDSQTPGEKIADRLRNEEKMKRATTTGE